jgi:amino acid permease
MASYSAIPPREADLRPSTPKIRRYDTPPRSLSANAASPRRRRDTGAFAGQASFISSVINLVNTIVGAGVLAMPRAMSQMGILLGTSVIIWSGIMAGFGLYLQTRCAQYLDRGHSSFFALSQLTYPNMAIVFDAAIAIKCFGVGVSYLIIIGDLMPGVVLGFNPAAGEAGYLVDRHFWITAFMYAIRLARPSLMC